ncbi:hypothetical protein Mapa_007306 [Marchantia paleacea]|nr:hypothetical protein Mapa_007306 [Marchantia paleacea]
MRRNVGTLALLFLVLSCIFVCGKCQDKFGLSSLAISKTDPVTQEIAAKGVLRRLLPRHESSFELRIVSEENCGGKACFYIDNHPSKNQAEGPEIRISGTSGVELCAGLYWYLKRWCGAHISWDKTGGKQLKTVPAPGSLPPVETGGVHVQRPVPWSYYQNVVTSSYSFVWWTWERWEQEIDWMALQGINLPLAFTGQESVWRKVFQSNRFNLSQADLDDYFGGPAFLAWARMGNLHGWGGPLSQTWMDQQHQLQLKILDQMRILGMIPVLPAFSGNVPSALQRIFPSAKITRLGNWNSVDGDERWCCTYLLDPTDPLFVEIGKAFVEQQIKEYGGTHHIYNCDTFNENLPPTNDPVYISTLGAAVYKAMSAGDNHAIWLMQGWLFASDDWFWKPPQMKAWLQLPFFFPHFYHSFPLLRSSQRDAYQDFRNISFSFSSRKILEEICLRPDRVSFNSFQALLHSVPVGQMVVLDLFADVEPVWQRSDHFYGIPYIWCMLHNFGGNTEMYGRVDTIGSAPIEALSSPNSTMVGVGMCMEGIEHNPVVYELMGEMSFRSQAVHLEDWISDYSSRRYGTASGGAQAAWKMLHQTIYNCQDGVADHNGDVIVEFPDKNPDVMHITGNRDSLKLRGSFTASGVRKPRGGGKLGHNPHLWYSQADAVKALGLLLSSADELGDGVPYRYDLVDLTRQVLSKTANEMYTDILAAYQSRKVENVRRLGNSLLELFSDMDKLLASCDGFLLGPWLDSAKSLSTNPEEKIQYEWNARTQITMWFDNTDEKPSSLHDYANKMWSGLIQDYYLPRAALYISFLDHSLRENATFPFNMWRKQWILLTNKWQTSHHSYPSKTVGDTVQIVRKLYIKYNVPVSFWLAFYNCTIDT